MKCSHVGCKAAAARFLHNPKHEAAMPPVIALCAAHADAFSAGLVGQGYVDRTPPATIRNVTVSWKHEGKYGPVYVQDNDKAKGLAGWGFGELPPDGIYNLGWGTVADAKRVAKAYGTTVEFN